MTVSKPDVCCDLARVDALDSARRKGVDARVTASNRAQSTPGEGYLRHDRDQ